MRTALAAAVLGSLILMVSPAPAFAHADVVSSTPRNGAQMRNPPGTVTITFGEPVTLDATKPSIVDGSGRVLPSTAAANDATLTITPSRNLARGSYAVSWHVISEDGHPVSGAIAFVVGPQGPRGSATTIATTPRVPTVLNGSRAGQLAVAFSHATQSGEVTWTSPSLPEPITWRVVGSASRAVASGVLPMAGTWTMQATLVGKDQSVVIVNGTTQIR